MTDDGLNFPRIIGHRGALGHAPENTLAGIRRAKLFGLSWVEFDVALTRDNVPVLMHDETVNRTTNGKGKLAEMTAASVRVLDAGSWKSEEFTGEHVPTLEEAFKTLQELGMGANIEIKPTKGREVETGTLVAKQVAAAWPQSLPRPLLSSFQSESLVAARNAAPGIARGYLLNRIGRNWRREAEALECVSIHCNQRPLDRKTAAEIRHAGYHLLSYTVNEASRARLLLDWGVDAVFTDYPDRLLTI